MNVKVGTEVSCPNCGKVMVRCIRVPETGSISWADCFENVEWTGRAGDWATCPCGGVFFVAGFGLYVKGIGYTW